MWQRIFNIVGPYFKRLQIGFPRNNKIKKIVYLKVSPTCENSGIYKPSKIAFQLICNSSFHKFIFARKRSF